MKRKIKKVLPCFLIFGLMLASSSFAWSERANTLHEIAELARSLGLPEESPIIAEAQRLWWEEYDTVSVAKLGETEEVYVEEPEPWYTQQDIDIVATVVYNEAGYGCTERHQELVAAVVVNRVNHWAFPNTVYGVVVAPYQYSAAYATYGSYYMNRAMQSDIWQHCCEIAERALRGEVDCPSNVVFQANFPQGHGVYEYGFTSYSTTYFCVY